MTTRHATPFALACIAALALTACGGDEESPASGAPTVTVTETTEAAEAPTAPEQQELTAAQISAALPREEDMPSGYAEHPDGFDADSTSERSADPESCMALYMSTEEMRTFSKEHSTQGEGVRYQRQQQKGYAPSIVVAVWTFDEPYPAKFFDQAGSALAECATYDTRFEPEANSVRNAATAIPTPTVGDQSFGVRLGDPQMDLGVDYLWVRSGHNLISVRMTTTWRMDNDQDLDTYAQGVIDELKKTP